MDVRKLILEDVRCFAGRQEFEIRPLTFLVGENSTGKSTILGCLQTTYNYVFGRPPGLDFNVEPYQMGTFSEIVRRSNRRLSEFKIGLELIPNNNKETIEYSLVFASKERGSEPTIQKHIIYSKVGTAEFTRRDDKPSRRDQSSEDYFTSLLIPDFETVDYKIDNNQTHFKICLNELAFESSVLSFFRRAKSRISRRNSISTLREKPQVYESKTEQDVAFDLFADNLWQTIEGKPSTKPSRGFFRPPQLYSFAPLRSRPQRTYDPLREEVSPDGSDIPMVLMNISRSDGDRWNKLRERLVGFGKSAGLFTDIHVRRLGKSMGDPFQLQIKVKGPKANLIDVGYGVNQILPILVRIFNSQRNMCFLMQQPEIHLHPRGQAELTSLLIESIKRIKHKFVIETHSDAMINRARIEIMNGGIAPEHVSLVYLEPTGNRVKVHNIKFDKQANLLGAPPSYRDFFINESDKLLGLSK